MSGMTLFGGTNKPLFGSTSGAATTSTGFGFGSTTTTATTAKPLFGSTTQASSTPSLFGTPATATSTSATTGGLFSNTPSGSLFAKRTATNAAGSSGGGLFGSTTGTGTGGGLFSNTTSGGLFSRPTATGGGLFGSTSTAAGTQQAATKEVETLQGILLNSDALVRSLTKPEYFGDERDAIIAKLNQLAAALGVGSGVHKRDQQPINYENGIFFRYKAIGYNKISELTDEDGIVSLVTKKPRTSLTTAAEKQAFLDTLFAIIGSSPSLKPHFMENGIRSLADGTTEVCIYIKENGQTMNSRKVAQALNQQNIANQLETQLQVDKTRIVPKVAMSAKQKEAYLRDAPAGFDSILWRQAVIENPDSKKLIPYPLRGFEQLKERQKAQSQEVEMQHKALNAMQKRIARLQEAHTKAALQMTQQKVTQKQLSHRLLRVLAMQLLTQKYSQGISAEEEHIYAALEHVNARLAAPNQIRDKIAQLSTKVTHEKDKFAVNVQEKSTLTDADAAQLRKYLLRCQDGLESLLSVISANRRDLDTVNNYLY